MSLKSLFAAPFATLAVVMVFGVQLACVPAQAAAKPNVIMIYTDDMGYSDISSFANVDLAATTPNIDRMATEGMKFTHFYVSMPICSPSRAAVLSGRFSPRNLTNYLNTRQYNSDSDQNDYMDPAVAYLPKSFQAAGYATGHIGKWHLGGGRDVDNPPSIRLFGYDEAYSTWESPNPDPKLGIKFTPWDYNNLEPGQVPRHQRTEYMVNKTLDFMQRHQDKPCFITLWPDDVHTPFTPNAAMKTKWSGITGQDNSRENFYGVLEEYDRQIGRLLDGIKAQGQESNTIIFFTGDNGPSPDFGTDRTNGMNGSKLSLFEGGVREPFIIRWPGHIQAGATNSQTVLSTVDLLPTLTGLAGIPMVEGAATGMDGEDLSAAMLGTPVTRTKPIYWEYGRTTTVPRPGAADVDRSPILAMREGDFKLLMNPDGTGKVLYNVRTNPNETTNLAAGQTALVNSMAAKLLAWSATLPHRSQPFPVFSTVNFNQYSISRLVSVSSLQSAAGASSTAGIDGVAVAPNGNDFVFAIHRDDLQNRSFIQINALDGQTTMIANASQIARDLGVPDAALNLTSGFDYSPGGDRLIFGEQDMTQPGVTGLVSLQLGTTSATLISQGSNLAGLNDHAMLPDGAIAVTRGTGGNKTVGTINHATGAWTQRVSEAQLIAAAPGNTSLPPDAIGVNSSLGESYVFAHGDSELFKVTNLMSGTVGVTRQAQPLLATIDVRDIAMDQAGNMFAYDAAGEMITVIRAGDSGLFGVRLSDVAAAIGAAGPIAPTEWRGLAARMADQNHAELFLASSNPQVGIVKVRFGTFPADVADWTLY